MSQPVDVARAPRRRDRTTLPCIAMIASCFLVAMGYSSKNVLLTWVLPGLLVGGSLLHAFLPRRGPRGRSTEPGAPRSSTQP
jgi:hypothetical protein